MENKYRPMGTKMSLALFRSTLLFTDLFIIDLVPYHNENDRMHIRKFKRIELNSI